MEIPFVSQHTLDYRRRMLERWGFKCVVCGLEFAHLACVTKEHLVPKLGRRDRRGRAKRPVHIHIDGDSSIAPSHWRCNMVRSTQSIISTAKLIEKKQKTMAEVDFRKWLNTPPPGARYPDIAFIPLRLQASFELPLQLPGIQRCLKISKAA
jgi:hypothetical protein